MLLRSITKHNKAFKFAPTYGLHNISNTIVKVRKEGGSIIFIQHCHSSLDVKEGDFFVEKEASDSFYETTLDSILEANGVNHVYVTGLQT